MKQILHKILKFREERNWHQTDTPDALAKSIIIEAAELLENFQWSNKPVSLINVKEELADIMIYTMALTYDLDFDLEKIIEEKLKKNEIKYPKGSIK